MSRFSVKSILLGIGIGIVFMSIVSIIYLAGMNPAKDLTEEEILKLAEKYDLVKRTDIISGETEAENTKNDNITASPTPAVVQKEAAKPAKEEKVTGTDTETKINTPVKILFTINEGATSESIAAKLYKAELIDNAAEFVKLLGDLGLEDNIQVGDFKISKGASKKEIAGIITK